MILLVGHAGRAGRQHEFAVLERHHLPADDPRHRQPRDGAERGKEQEQLPDRRLAAEERQQHDHDHHVGDRVQHVDDPHHHVVHVSAQVAGCRPIRDADDQRHQRGDDADHQRDAPAEQHARENVAARAVGAHGVRERERPVRRLSVAGTTGSSLASAGM